MKVYILLSAVDDVFFGIFENEYDAIEAIVQYKLEVDEFFDNGFDYTDALITAIENDDDELKSILMTRYANYLHEGIKSKEIETDFFIMETNFGYCKL